MSEKDYYPDGAYNDPNAPWNQDDTEIEEKKWAVFCDRLDDEPDVWIAEGLTEAMDASEGLYKKIIDNLKSDGLDAELGSMVRFMIEEYTMPSDDDALEMIKNGE